eukprot:CAMPEP_0118854458 /NCGR_PEP_ID=MMETSP1163-20130328/2668_1 /TAXON_ID=124430 /ORGANISM="Phaeomonas parva, Strain CCMP2877" /LENGTH=55 /DNA_ID=CAMNT_0006787189 /DNA_START=48 /DNA_END=215 /DNA_ORIENTATION=-
MVPAIGGAAVAAAARARRSGSSGRKAITISCGKAARRALAQPMVSGEWWLSSVAG